MESQHYKNPHAGREMLNISEKRRTPRYKGKLPMELEAGSGLTRDFSGSGVFFETDASYSPGQSIVFTIILKHIDPDHPVRLKCKGEIVRVEENGLKIGVAASITSYTFEELYKINSMLN